MITDPMAWLEYAHCFHQQGELVFSCPRVHFCHPLTTLSLAYSIPPPWHPDTWPESSGATIATARPHESKLTQYIS